MRTVLRLLIFLLPTQLSLHFWPDWAYVYGIRVDYFSPTIYLTDILIVIFLLLFLKNSREVVMGTIRKYKYFIFLATAFSVVNILVSQNPQIAILKWVKVYEFILFIFAIAKTKLDRVKDVFMPLLLSIILLSAVGIGQFVKQGSIGGLLYFLGERSFTPSQPGIALVQVSGVDYLRSYSTFPHPNALSGYLLASLFLILLSRHHLLSKTLINFTLLVGLCALFLTFSFTVYSVGFFLMSVCFIVKKVSLRVRRIATLSLVVCIGLSMALPVLSNIIFFKGSPSLTNSLDVYERLWLAIASGELLVRSSLMGVGLNNFIYLLPTTQLPSPVIWILQPVHNIFLLTLVETGVLGLLFFSATLYKIFDRLLRIGGLTFLIPLAAILLTGMGDHYWLTIQQNQLLFALVVGLSFNESDTS